MLQKNIWIIIRSNFSFWSLLSSVVPKVDYLVSYVGSMGREFFELLGSGGRKLEKLNCDINFLLICKRKCYQCLLGTNKVWTQTRKLFPKFHNFSSKQSLKTCKKWIICFSNLLFREIFCHCNLHWGWSRMLLRKLCKNMNYHKIKPFVLTFVIKFCV